MINDFSKCHRKTALTHKRSPMSVNHVTLAKVRKLYAWANHRGDWENYIFQITGLCRASLSCYTMFKILTSMCLKLWEHFDVHYPSICSSLSNFYIITKRFFNFCPKIPKELCGTCYILILIVLLYSFPGKFLKDSCYSPHSTCLHNTQTCGKAHMVLVEVFPMCVTGPWMSSLTFLFEPRFYLNSVTVITKMELPGKYLSFLLSADLNF